MIPISKAKICIHVYVMITVNYPDHFSFLLESTLLKQLNFHMIW